MNVMEHNRPSGRTRRRFTKEFKADAVALVLDGGLAVARAAHDLGVGDPNLGSWVGQARIDRGENPGLTTAERAELVRLRRENAKLRKGGLLNRRRWRTRLELSNAIFEQLEIFRNRQRWHPALGMLTPVEHERRHATNPARDQAS